MALPILDVRHLSVCYPTPLGPLRAVRDLSLSIFPGETLALVGETGCGKSTVALSLLGLLGAGWIESGSILFDECDLRGLKKREWRKIRGSQVGIVFQDARSALNPVLTVGDHLVETIRAHRQLSGRSAREQSLALLREVGIPDPRFLVRRYPFELSGGMCQRVGIALGICNNPRLLIADEPTSSLDSTIQMQIMELLDEMKSRHSLSLLLISHDLDLVSEFANHIAVMYHSRMVEYGPGSSLLTNHLHPYTRALSEAAPSMSHRCDSRPLEAIPGTAPAPNEEFQGCPFAPRCCYSEPRCSREFPAPTVISDDHWVACVRHMQ